MQQMGARPAPLFSLRNLWFRTGLSLCLHCSSLTGLQHCPDQVEVILDLCIYNFFSYPTVN